MLSNISKFKARHQTMFTIVIALAVVAFWRGIWGLMDLFIFPDSYLLSSITSVIIGLAILVATHYVAKLA